MVRACAEGSENAWEEFVRRTRKLVGLVIFRTARQGAGPSPALVEDLIQETYLKLCAHQRRLLRDFHPRSDEAVFAYVKLVARSVANDYLKAQGSQKRGARLTTPDQRGEISDDSRAQTAMERQILLRQIDDCLRKNPEPSDRHIFWLHYRSGLSVRAIGEIPGVCKTTKFLEKRIAKLTAAVRELLISSDAGQDVSKNSGNLVVGTGESEIG